MKWAYYNEFDHATAKWLRTLIDAGHIAPGVVDERSIEDVEPSDLRGFSQCHFFAGIGVWSYALRQAGWEDSRHVWTASLPCQPWSIAGARKGQGDDRHLLPVFFSLLRERQPDTVFGEQVSNNLALAWLDDLQDRLEGENYAVGALGTCAAGVGAPHTRQRLYWTARKLERVADPVSYRLQGRLPRGENAPRKVVDGSSGRDSATCDPRETNGFWREVDWVLCKDGNWRPAQPGVEPLAEGAPARVGRLCGYGNAIVAQQAAAFIRASAEDLA